MTLSELRERTMYWQERLNLREWDISIQWGTPREMEEALGLCLWNVEELSAVIKLRRRGAQQESTLVHELLHITLQGHEDYSTYDQHLERAINRIAAALIQ